MENEIVKKDRMKKNIIPLALGILVLIILIIVFTFKKDRETSNPSLEDDGLNVGGDTNVAIEIDVEDPAFDASTPINDEATLETNEVFELENGDEASVVISGANPVNIENIVLTKSGEVANNKAIPGSDGAPRSTGFLTPELLPESVLKIEVGNGAFSPKQFTTSAGMPTTFSLTSTDNLVHTLRFDHRDLSGIVILVGPGQTKAITFNAPENPGIYNFKCISHGHEAKGEVGQLIVK
ncbi:cupredoxin domain-containing protein [Patescibacteria group bacterium]|nr:cupredoxin domain-containing protein [Patescibacteria group bacterium]